MNVTLHEVARVLAVRNDISQFEDFDLQKPEFDSRLIGPGDLFVPLKGARDGHDFIETAFENGAVATLSEKEVEGHPYLLVDDVLAAFQKLAQYVLEKSQVDVLAVTGSNGKTTTKDMLAQFLIRFSICQKGQRSLSLKWGRTIWEIFIFSQKLRIQRQQS